MNKVFLHQQTDLKHTDLAIYDAQYFTDFKLGLEALEKALQIVMDVIVIVHDSSQESHYLQHLCASEQLIFLNIQTKDYDLEKIINFSSNYSKFAKYYDFLQAEIDVKAWFTHLKPYLKADSYIVEAACGSGKLAKYLTNYNYLGYDLSSEMINQASIKNTGTFIVADMLNFKSVNVDIYCAFLDSINYLGSLENLKIFFKNVYRSLSDEGIFIFDAHQLKILEVFKDYYYLDTYEAFELSWKTKVVEQNLYHNIVIYDEIINYELHHEYIFSVEEIESLLKEIGFVIIKKALIYEHDLYVVRRKK